MLPNVVIRHDAVTGKKIPAIVFNGQQYDDIIISWKAGGEMHVKMMGMMALYGTVPAEYDIVKVDYITTEWLIFEFYKQFGEGIRAGMEQAISSFSVSGHDIDRIQLVGPGLMNDYML